MINHRYYVRKLLFLVLAALCAAEGVCAEDANPESDDLVVVLDRKQYAGLVMSQSPPDYPPVAKVNYVQGKVHLLLIVNRRGRVTLAHVLRGNAVLAASALKAAHRWTYHPLITPSGPRAFMTRVTLDFILNYRTRELTPRQAERDFLRQVKPPRVVRPPEVARPKRVAHLQLLVDNEGQVIDMDGPSPKGMKFEAMREALRHWIFHPAHWGNIPVASYVEVDVPVGGLSAAGTSTNSSSQ